MKMSGQEHERRGNQGVRGEGQPVRYRVTTTRNSDVSIDVEHQSMIHCTYHLGARFP